LELILQKLDDRLDLKLYAIVFNGNQDFIETVRVKNVLSDQKDKETDVIQEKLNGPEDIFEKLGLSPKQESDIKLLLEKLDTTSFTDLFEKLAEPNVIDHQATVGIDEFLPIRQESNERIFYSNRFKFELKEQIFTIQYIVSIEIADEVIRKIYVERPKLSFLRLILDLYFKDYYKVTGDYDQLLIGLNTNIENKYKEDSIRFLQRMARLFFGKIQQFIHNGISLKATEGLDIDVSEADMEQYHNKNLLEKIDGISTRTYEGGSPIGCMLLFKTELKDSGLVNYSIKFREDQPIYLEDARRIRKLLELTNSERDLYLIADEQAIYGVGEVDWSELGDHLVFKVEFKGLSRYDLLLVTTKKKPNTDARVVVEDDSKIFKMTTNLEIVSHKLSSISFKHPGIGAGGFTPELFDRTMRAQFNNLLTPITNQAIERLRLVIQKAIEQRSGTMVVITDEETAKSELNKLRKQSTPIVPDKISPAFIKHLTSIDGAIYFDTTGACHAIGVILDGLAYGHSGDASRGARFHSAYRYMEKLKNDNKGCVIAIISEDGMVNLIPEQVNEAKVRQLVRTMIGYINDNDVLDDQEIQEYEKLLKEVARETVVDHHHYFKVAETFHKKAHYLESARYYKLGLGAYGNFYLQYNRALGASYLRYGISFERVDDRNLQYFEEAEKQFELIKKMVTESELPPRL